MEPPKRDKPHCNVTGPCQQYHPSQVPSLSTAIADYLADNDGSSMFGHGRTGGWRLGLMIVPSVDQVKELPGRRA